MHALLNFKQGVIDPSGLLSSWFTQQDCCQWNGVTCDNVTHRVTELHLPCSTDLPTYTDKEDKSHCLTGSIHLSLPLFEYLYYLNLRNNDFLTIHFDFVDSQNCHNMSVATPQCVNFSILHHLDLSNNENLTMDSLQWLSHFSSLEYLNLGFIDLHKETNWLQLVTMLPSLSSLQLPGCQLENLSPSLPYANFTALKVLFLHENEFDSELPKWLFNLSCGISDIDISSSSLRGQLPEALLNLRHLELLALQDNNLSGRVPEWLGQFEYLQVLVLGINMFSGSVPTHLGNLSTLTTLYVGSNQLTGVVSERNFAKLANLKELEMSLSPPLIFDFNSHWIPPFQLEELVFAFAGPTFPMWLYTQRSIDVLHIPPQICQMTSLIILDIADNRVSGDIPNCLSNITTLVSNKASRSKFTFWFRLSGNRYWFSPDTLELATKGVVAEYDNNLHFMTLIDLSSNDLSGTIPPQMFSLIGLVTLNFSFNKLVGRIPQEIGNMKNLESLDLSRNQLSGEIPESMSGLSFLSFLNLSCNNLTGRIPSGTQLQGFSSLSYIGNPYLCGPPLTQNCSPDTKTEERNPIDEDENEDEFMTWFYIGIASGFVIGYLGVCGAIFFNRKLRHAYFKFIQDLKDKLYVMIAIKMNSFR